MVDEFSGYKTGIKSRNELLLGPLTIEMYGKYLLVAVFATVIAAALGEFEEEEHKFQECSAKTGVKRSRS